MNVRTEIIPTKAPEAKVRSDAGPLYRVFVHNDDVTPMDFVVHVLSTIFMVASPNAEYIMYSAHVAGKAYVQTLPGHEARRRIGHAHLAARLRGLPLEFSMEPE